MEVVSMPPVFGLLFLHGLLFSTGLFLAITRRSIIFVLIGVELMIQAVKANCIALDGLQGTPSHGQVLAIFATVVTACEGVVLLALSLWIYQKTHSSAIGKK